MILKIIIRKNLFIREIIELFDVLGYLYLLFVSHTKDFKNWYITLAENHIHNNGLNYSLTFIYILG